MKVSELQLLLQKYIAAKREEQDFLEQDAEDNPLYSSKVRADLASSIFTKYDSDNNGELTKDELVNLSRTMSEYDDFLSGISMDSFSESLDEAAPVDWEELTNAIYDFEIGIDPALVEEDMALAQMEDTDDTSDMYYSDDLYIVEVDETVKDYNNKTNVAEFAMLLDENITKEQTVKRTDLIEQLDSNYNKISELMAQKDNLSDEQKLELAQLIQDRKDMLSSREALEAQILEAVKPETIIAIENMLEARSNLDNTQLESLEAMDELEAQLEDVIGEAMDMVEQKEEVEEVEKPQVTNPGNYTGSYASTPTGNEQMPDAKTKEQLQKELAEAKEELAGNEQNYNEILDDSEPTLSKLKDNANTAFENYQKLLNEVSPELAESLEAVKIKKDEKQEQINNKEVQIATKESDISNLQLSLDSINATLASCQLAIANLDSTDTANLSDEQKSKISSRKAELIEQQNAAISEKANLEDSIATANKDLSGYKAELTTFNTELSELTTEYNDIQAQVDALNNSELTALKDTYIQAQEEFESTKETMKTEAKSAVDASKTKVETIQKEIDVLSVQEIEAQSRIGLNGNPVSFNGSVYDSVVPVEDINKLLDLIANTSATTRSGHNDMCAAFSVWYGQYLMGTASAGQFEQFKTPGQVRWGNGSVGVKDMANDNKDVVLTAVADEISAGRPAILQVGANKNTSRHYVLVVGIKEGAPYPPRESDLLIVDTYDGRLEGMGEDGTRTMITGAKCHKDYSGYQMYRFI